VKKAIIFDMDGTLINSIPKHFRNHQRIIKEVTGHHLTKEYFYNYCNGSSPKEFYHRILNDNKIPLKLIKDIEKKDKKYLNDEFILSLKVFPYVKTELKALKKQGVKLAVATSSPKKIALKVLENNKLTQYFDVIITKNDVKESKPNPEIFLLARRALGIPKKDCVVIEDAINGFKAAKRAGIDCFGILTSLSKKQLPKYVKPVHDHKELSKALLR
jgi:HAD superfamily hydrolase (TIGR01509 family)